MPTAGRDDAVKDGPNSALRDEIEPLNSIYGPDTVSVHASSDHETTGVLRLPDSVISFLVSVPAQYPDVPPEILGTQSIGHSGRKGEGEVAVSILRDVLSRVWTEGQVCLFDLVEEATPLLSQQHEGGYEEPGALEDHEEHTANRSAPPQHNTHAYEQDYDLKSFPDTTTANASTLPEPNWTQSDPLTFSKSTFVARACAVDSLEQAQFALSHLLATNKKAAAATHNISAWRIRAPSSAVSAHYPSTALETVIQDCDDDGETAAGGRLLHLMQLMDVWNVLVVVTRWYGGVKLGPDRFRLINQAGREALVKGGFAKDKEDGGKGGSGHKGKGRK